MRVDSSTSHPAPQENSKVAQQDAENDSWLEAMYKQVLENRAGIDSKKIDEIEAKIEALKNDKTLSPEERKKMIAALEQEKKELLEQFARETAEKEKAHPNDGAQLSQQTPLAMQLSLAEQTAALPQHRKIYF